MLNIRQKAEISTFIIVIAIISLDFANSEIIIVTYY